jgi:hypothetical protein
MGVRHRTDGGRVSSTKLASLLLLATGVGACAGQYERITTASAAGLKGRYVAARVRSPPLFRAEQPGIIYPLGAVGAILAEAAAERFAREHPIVDPAPRMAQQLTDYLRRRHGLHLAATNGPAGRADPNQIVGARASDDLVVEVWTDAWALSPIVPYPRKRTKYRLEYSASLRLVDAKIDRVVDGRRGLPLARGSCSYISKQKLGVATYDEFLAEGARRLMAELDVAMAFCTDEFRSKVLTEPGAL